MIRVDAMPGTIPELLRHQAAARPGAVACCRRAGPGRWLPSTWQEVWDEIGRAAAALSALGLARGDRLAVLAPSRRDWLVAEMAGMLAGAAVVGVDPHALPEDIQLILNHSGARGLVVDRAERLAQLPACRGLRFVAALEGAEGTVGGARVLSWRDLLARQPPGPHEDGHRPAPDDPAALIYTAGTTGTPKGIEYTHRQVLVACQAMLEAFPQIEEGDTTICWLPMAHLFQRMMNLVAVARGLTIYFLEDPRQIMAAVREVEPSAFVAVPRFYEKLHEGIRAQLAQASGWRRRLIDAALAAGAEWARAERQGARPPWPLRLRHGLLDRLVLRRVRRKAMGRNLKFMITGTAPTPAWLLEFFHALGWLVLEAYGLSENTVPMAANRPTAYRFGSVGRPFPANEIAFADDGEILVRGPGVFRGYAGEAPGAGPFTPDGYYRTGDYGRLDEGGFLYLQGRKAEIIKTSTGRRIAPARVEAAYRQSPCLDQVVVFGDGRKHLVALVGLNAGAVAAALARAGVAAPAPDQLAQSAAVRDLVRSELDACGRELAPHEQVRAFAILAEPLSLTAGELTPTLKLRRSHIAARHAALIDALYAEGEAAAPAPTGDGR